MPKTYSFLCQRTHRILVIIITSEADEKQKTQEHDRNSLNNVCKHLQVKKHNFLIFSQ